MRVRFFTTSLGRLVAEHDERGTLLEDLILKVLYDYRTNPFNASNFPLSAQALARAAHLDVPTATAGADALVGKGLVELVEGQTLQPGGTLGPRYRITGSGMVFVLNVSEGLQGVV